MAAAKVMVRMLSRGTPDARAEANLFCRIAKDRPDWDVAVHINHVAVDDARLMVIHEARKADPDFLIMLDDDVTPNPKVVNLPDHDVPIVGGLVPVWRDGAFYWNAYRMNPLHHRLVPISTWTPGKLEQVYAIGGAIMCLRRDILRMDYADPFFEVQTREKEGKIETVGEDIFFCRKMRAWNIDVFVDPDVQGDHTTRVSLLQTMVRAQKEGANFVKTFCGGEERAEWGLPYDFGADEDPRMAAACSTS